MEKLYSVRVIRKENQAVQGVYIEEFWKFCGVYTSEFITEYAGTIQDTDLVDCNIILDEDAVYLNRLKAKHSVTFSNLKKHSDLSSRDKRKRLGRKIERELLLKIAELFEWNKEWIRDFKKICKAFVESDFAYSNYLTHLFLDQFSEDMKLMQIDIFSDCMDMIYTVGATLTGSPYRKFAYLNCMRKINRICLSEGTRRVFDDELIMKVAHQLSVDDEAFSMGNVLAGLVGLSRRKFWNQGQLYMEEVLDKEGDNKYSAFVYYALAHFLEVEEQEKQEAWELYHHMGEIAPQSYRMLFKRATELFHQEKNSEWCNKFFQIYKLMKEKEARGWIQPLELEYYYKCAKILNRIPADISERMGIKHIEERDIEEIKIDKFSSSNFMKNFIFDNNLKLVYMKYFQEKMGSHDFDKIVGQI